MFFLFLFFLFLKIFIENRLDEHQETVSVFVGAYDLDTTDELTIFEKTNANGTFDVTPVDPLTRDSIFDCNKTMVNFIAKNDIFFF